MRNALIPTFGRRRPENELTQTQERLPQPPPLPLPPEESSAGKAGGTTANPVLLELRQLALGRLDPAMVASMSADKLTAEVERLLAEIANEQRMQLNAREQKALALELVDDMLGLGPIEPLLDDDTITDIMINGPDKVFVERRGTVVLSNVRFRDVQHLSNIA
jgi:pilus assembly protein CpaF